MVENIIFVDSGAFIALADESDSKHQAATDFAETLGPGEDLVTTELVLAETASFLQTHIGLKASRKFWQRILDGNAGVRLEWATASDLTRAWRIGQNYEDQAFSLVDCVSFAVIERMRIPQAFAFDGHFLVFRPARGKLARVP